ncbi:hypothetical protein KBP30_00325 [Streptomyces sp. Go40/10]|uniref:hypothetical protein n=1 Tax=Streptomyces sp. Go40/10 TaxID=2825844 RepID=UPI001E2F23BA|nr:hypothetical protein [Streptomyces sp. Go40/10]UFQ99776.1 hypothetical protein KBP30_00325 [Streptomyces sp. Go40/10]
MQVTHHHGALTSPGDATSFHALHGRDTRDCALAYTHVLGWPIALGHRCNRSAGCTCGAFTCPSPGAHPVTEPVIQLTAGELAEEIEARPGAGLIAPCVPFDAVSVSYPAGMALTLALELHGVYVPCVQKDHAIAVFCLAPGSGCHLAGQGVIVRSGTSAWTALPPSQNLRWDTLPTAGQTLPDAAHLIAPLREALRGISSSDVINPGNQRRKPPSPAVSAPDALCRAARTLFLLDLPRAPRPSL